MASVSGQKRVVCSRKVVIEADVTLEEVSNQEFDMIVLPGGLKGAESFRDCEQLQSMLRKQREEKKHLAAICASPAVAMEPLIGHSKATCYPSFMEKLRNPSEERVVVEEGGKLVTSRSPGTAIEFALSLVQILFGRPKAEEVAKAMLHKL